MTAIWANFMPQYFYLLLQVIYNPPRVFNPRVTPLPLPLYIGHSLGEVKVYNEIIKREEQEEQTTMTKSFENHEVISILTKEARRSMDHEHFEDAALKLHRCLQLEDEPEWRPVFSITFATLS